MNKGTAALVAVTIVASTGALTACDPGPECIRYETRTTLEYHPESAPNYRPVVKSVCVEYATETKDNS
jgi:hypothetical protein